MSQRRPRRQRKFLHKQTLSDYQKKLFMRNRSRKVGFWLLLSKM